MQYLEAKMYAIKAIAQVTTSGVNFKLSACNRWSQVTLFFIYNKDNLSR